MPRLPLLVAISMSILSCSSPSGPPAGTPARGGAIRRADPTPPPGPDTVDEAEEAGAAAPVEAPAEPLAASCEGAAIDLREVFEMGMCQVEGKGDRIPAGVTRSIDPGVIEVKAGGPARGAIRLENGGSAPADVFLSLPCELGDQIGTWIENPSNRQPVDTDRPACEERSASGCLATVHHIRLPPGGTARFPFEAATAIRSWDEQCQTQRGRGAVARGRYKLRVRALFLGATLDADLVVR